MRLSGIAATAVAVAAAGAGLLPAAPAAASTRDLGLVVPLLSPMLPGQSGWVGDTLRPGALNYTAFRLSGGLGPLAGNWAAGIRTAVRYAVADTPTTGVMGR